MEALNASFRLPALSEWKDLTSEALLASALTTDMSLSSAIQEAMGQMETPWLDTANAFSSARGFGDLQILGVSLDESPPFDDQLTEQLRTALGDWRTAQLEIPRIEADLNARTRFYHEQGLDFALSAFPAPAFDQATKIARIQQPPTTLIVLYDYVIPARSREEAAEFKRTNEAHDRLQRFETRFRAFIEARLKEKFGPRWVKERDPQTLMPRGKRRPSERKILATSLDL
jgi:hypothetical protein